MGGVSMDAYDSLLKRRSIRSFNEKPVEEEKIGKIIHAGLLAASGKNRQSAIIIEVRDRETRDMLSRLNAKIGGFPEGFDPFYHAPVILVVLARKDVNTHVYDGSLVMGNLLQASYDLGLGSIWIHRAKEEFESEEGKELLRKLNIQGDYEGIGHCAIGYTDNLDIPSHPIEKGRVYKI